MKIVLVIFALLALVLSASAYDSVCNGRGIFQNKRCQCHPDYIGARCQTRICNRGSSLEIACNVQGGICDSISYPARCLCKPGFQGSDCSVRSVQDVSSDLQGSYTGTVELFPINPNNTNCLGESQCKGFTGTLSSFTVTATSITAVASSFKASGNCTTELPIMTVTLSNANVTGSTFTGNMTLKAGETTLASNVDSKVTYGVDGTTVTLAYNLGNPTNPPATSVNPLTQSCSTNIKYVKFAVAKSVTPSSGSTLSASLFMFLSVLASILAFL